MRSHPCLFALVAALAFALPLTAQVTSVPNSGCANAADVMVTGTLTPGSRIQLQCPSIGGGTPVMLLGVTLAPATLMPPLACGGPCELAFAPNIDVTGASLVANLPNDPSSVGRCFYAQCATIDQANQCIHLSGAVRICIQ